MHPLHEYLASLLAEQIQRSQVVVWFDQRREFEPFVLELLESSELPDQPSVVRLRELKVHLVVCKESMLAARMAVEPFVCDDRPQPTLVYLPDRNEENTQTSLFMELQLGGISYQRDLKRLAHGVLSRFHPEGLITSLIRGDDVGYAEIKKLCQPNGGVSPLKIALKDLSTPTEQIATWLTDTSLDGKILERKATQELAEMIFARIGLSLPEEGDLPKWRAITTRTVLINEFRNDLKGAPAGFLNSVPEAKRSEHLQCMRDVAARMRHFHPEDYPTIADGIQKEMHLDEREIPANTLGAIDTFRFEEMALLRYCGDLLKQGDHHSVLEIARQRQDCFWLRIDRQRAMHWDAARLMAELGLACQEARKQMLKAGDSPREWVEAYTRHDGWYRMDQAQRRLETVVAGMEEEIEEVPLQVLRTLYEDTCSQMAEEYARRLEKHGWGVDGILPQAKVFDAEVRLGAEPMAWVLVDSLRFEMGRDLADRLPKGAEVHVKPARAALPTITTIGMAALLPNAASTLSITSQNGKLGAEVDQVFLPDLAARRKYLSGRFPDVLDMTLDELLIRPLSRTAKAVAGHRLVVVRSQEIDLAGEQGRTVQARQMMDTMVDNLSRAIARLARVGITKIVVVADHGHLFLQDRDDSQRIDPPGGDTVELHRRCWIGRGGSTPGGCIRVKGDQLGYATDLEVVFPRRVGMFKASGDLAYCHGGPTLQESIVPVLSIRMPSPVVETGKGKKTKGHAVELFQLPPEIRNRFFPAQISLTESDMYTTSRQVRPVLMVGDQVVGRLGMASGAEMNQETGVLLLAPKTRVSIVFQVVKDMLPGESGGESRLSGLSVVVLDPQTDAELCRSQEIPVHLN